MAAQKVVKVAVIFKNPLNDAEFLLTKQNPPPKFNDHEYDSYQDSELWDLPSVQLDDTSSTSTVVNSQLQIQADDVEDNSLLNGSDLNSALNQVLVQVALEKPAAPTAKWKFSKIIEEPDFGPGLPLKTIYVIGELEPRYTNLDLCKWMSTKDCADLLLEVKPNNSRIGPLVFIGLLEDSMQCNLDIPPVVRCQEYPPGVKLFPMRSRTGKPFQTTNLVVFVPQTSCDDPDGHNVVASGDALIVDPGCSSTMHKELQQIITALPRKLVVFVTHHHHDHVDGLSVVQKCNPDATLLAHENTFRRIRKDDWSLGYQPILGSEEISIGGQRLRLISAPGHTDGHMALLHTTSNTLIVGDHCVGQGSAILDITSGGNMTDYFQTTYKFMELSPHVLIPMHGRVNMWPKHMLCGYLKNRRNRESTILQAIQGGAKTLFDIVAYTYADVDRSFWIPAASNVRLHVEHLAEQNKLPKEFSMQRFQSTCRINFILRLTWAYLHGTLSLKGHSLQIGKVLGAGTVAAVAVLFTVREIFSSKKHL